MKYTHPRLLLKPNEVDLYDLMLKTSRLIREASDGGIGEIAALLTGEEDLGSIDEKQIEHARFGLQKLLTYMFTCGVAFAVDQQVKNAVKTIEGLQKN